LTSVQEIDAEENSPKHEDKRGLRFDELLEVERDLGTE
jgi:hypothetical protein